MTQSEKIKKEIDKCNENIKPLIEYLQDKNENDKFSFHLEYQKWYSRVLKVIEFLAPDRLNEFKSYYEVDTKRKSLGYGTYVIQDYIKGVVPNNRDYPNFDSKSQALQNLYNQYTIFHSIWGRLDSAINDIKKSLFSELQDLELENAKSLLKINIRAAGIIAGVILESYLHTIVESHKIKMSKKTPTFIDLNEALKSNQIYDIATWRKISYLADIRNLCAHSKGKEPTKEQVEDLIEGVNWVMKNIN